MAPAKAIARSNHGDGAGNCLAYRQVSGLSEILRLLVDTLRIWQQIKHLPGYKL